tara:strand:+ start:788 stop:1120 length:333 start_codon:yes stop_codon:yes gene_type:complete
LCSFGGQELERTVSPCSPRTILTADRSIRPLQWADLAEGRLRLDRLCRNGAGQLSSPAGCAVIPRETRKFPGRHPPLMLRSQAMRRRSPPASPIAIEAAWCGLELKIKET